MLNDNQTPIEERVFEFVERQGETEKTFAATLAGTPINKLHEKAILGTKEEIQRLTTTQLVCILINSGKMDFSKSGFFLAVNIYSTVYQLEAVARKLTKSQRQKSTSTNYSELPYYKKMKRYLETLPNLGIVSEMFVCTGEITEFRHISIPKLGKIKKKIVNLLDQMGKHKEYSLASELQAYLNHFTATNNYFISRTNNSNEFFKSKVIRFDVFSSLKDAFEICCWPSIETELSVQKLLRDLEETEQKFKQNIQISKVKPSKAKISDEKATESIKTSFELDITIPTALEEKAENSSILTTLSKEESTKEDIDISSNEEDEEDEGESSSDDAKGATFMEAARGIQAEAVKKSVAIIPKATSQASSSSYVSCVTKALDWMRELKGQSKQVDFWDMLKAFKTSLKADVEESQVTEISFRGPNQKLTKIFCDIPHGAQLKKAWPAWRYNMIRGLVAAGFEF